MTLDPLVARVEAEIALLVCSQPGVPVQRIRTELAELPSRLIGLAMADLYALAGRDAAASADPRYVYDSYASYHAVLGYRVAHSLFELGRTLVTFDRPASDLLRTAARRLSEQTKVRTGVEIHPGASIGQRFVIDHGLGTVIGEQTVIGDDCYLLHGVTLGGRSIGRSYSSGAGRRHPRIGNRVEIGGGVSVFGPVTVGDDCRLDAGVQITTDIPAGARVRLVTATQICTIGNRIEIHSVDALSGP